MPKRTSLSLPRPTPSRSSGGQSGGGGGFYVPIRCSRGLQKAALYTVIGTLALLYLGGTTNIWTPLSGGGGQGGGLFGGKWLASARGGDIQALREVADGDGKDLMAVVDNMSRSLNEQAAARQAQEQLMLQQQQQQQQVIMVDPAASGDLVEEDSVAPAVVVDSYMSGSQTYGVPISSSAPATSSCPAGSVYSPHCRACFQLPASPPLLKFNFIHFPKAAGTAFTIPLRRLLSCEPAGKGCWGDPAVVVNGNINCEGRFTGCYGHNGFAPDANKMSIALFRHPVGRVRSAFHHDRHLDGGTTEEKTAVKQTTSLEEYIRFPGVRNCQTKMVLGYRCATRKRMDETQFVEAKRAVDSLDYIGITEHYNTSVCLLFKQVGVLPVDSDFTTWRKSHAYNSEEVVPMTTQQTILNEDYYDAHLYARALAAFKDRVKAEGLVLLEPPSQYESLPLPANPPDIV